jgi:23S rRNA maturation-related 3'-5' exoribonuclease YhaM
LVLVVAPRYPQLDQDKLLIGAFLHDAAKTDELSYDRDIAYTDEGQLLGHMVMAMTMVDDKVREAERLSGEPFPKSLVLEIKHMIISHHGEYEFGSPKPLKQGEWGNILERTVVASDAFGESLKRGRILMVHDCHYLPVVARAPHLVVASSE